MDYLATIWCKVERCFQQIGSTYTNWRQFGTQVSDASSECPNTRIPMFGVQTVKNKDLAVPQPDLYVCADRKIVVLFLQLCYFTKKTGFSGSATQIENFKMVLFRLQRKTIHALSYAQLRSRLFSKENTALETFRLCSYAFEPPRNFQTSFFVFRWHPMFIACFFVIFCMQLHRYTDTQIGVPAFLPLMHASSLKQSFG